MSASETGEDLPLVQFFNLVRNSDLASAPASRTTVVKSCASRASRSALSSTAAKRQALDAQGRRVDAVAEFQIVGRNQRLEDVEQVAGDGHLADGIGDLAVLDPEAGGAAAVVAGDAVDAGTDQVGDVKTLLDVGNQLPRRHAARLEVQVVGAGRRRGRHAAVGVAGGGHAEFARGGAVEQPRSQHALI